MELAGKILSSEVELGEDHHKIDHIVQHSFESIEAKQMLNAW